MGKATYFSLFLLVLVVATSIGVEVTEAQQCGWKSTQDCCYKCGDKCLKLWGGVQPSSGNYWACYKGACWCWYGSC